MATMPKNCWLKSIGFSCYSTLHRWMFVYNV